MSKSRKRWLISAGAFLLLVITNPTPKDFKDYIGLDKNESYSEVRRQYNFFLFSVYNDTRNNQQSKYVGVATNFIDISKSGRPEAADSVRAADSAAKVAAYSNSIDDNIAVKEAEYKWKGNQIYTLQQLYNMGYSSSDINKALDNRNFVSFPNQRYAKRLASDYDFLKIERPIFDEHGVLIKYKDLSNNVPPLPKGVKIK